MPNEICPCAAVEELKEIVKKQGEQLAEHQKRLYDGNTAFEIMRRDISTLTDSVNKNTSKLDEMLSKPAKRWDGIVTQIIGLCVAAVVGYLLSGGAL